MSATTIFAPSLAKSIAVSRPIPEAAPVIIATLSLRFIFYSPFELLMCQK
jgi:hypothetical protein